MLSERGKLPTAAADISFLKEVSDDRRLSLRRDRWLRTPATSADHASGGATHLRSQFARFIVTGGIAAGVNVLTRWLLGFVMSYELAIALAYGVGMTTAFVLARMFVFDGSTGAAGTQYLRFTLVNVVAFAQVWLVSVGLVRYVFPVLGLTWQAETVAHIIGVASPVVTSYFAHRHFSFRQAG
jgi:putative flippase GtrA